MKELSREISHRLAECIHICHDCTASCLNEEHVKMMTECIRLNEACAEVCTMTLNMVHKDGRFTKEVLTLCEQVCIACGQECKKHPEDHCQECYQACMACAEACRKFREAI